MAASSATLEGEQRYAQTAGQTTSTTYKHYSFHVYITSDAVWEPKMGILCGSDLWEFKFSDPVYTRIHTQQRVNDTVGLVPWSTRTQGDIVALTSKTRTYQ